MEVIAKERNTVTFNSRYIFSCISEKQPETAMLAMRPEVNMLRCLVKNVLGPDLCLVQLSSVPSKLNISTCDGEQWTIYKTGGICYFHGSPTKADLSTWAFQSGACRAASRQVSHNRSTEFCFHKHFRYFSLAKAPSRLHFVLQQWWTSNMIVFVETSYFLITQRVT